LSNSRSLDLGVVNASAAGTYSCQAFGVTGSKMVEHTLSVQVGCQPTITKYVSLYLTLHPITLCTGCI